MDSSAYTSTHGLPNTSITMGSQEVLFLAAGLTAML